MKAGLTNILDWSFIKISSLKISRELNKSTQVLLECEAVNQDKKYFGYMILKH
jgi:hypothetical protein